MSGFSIIGNMAYTRQIQTALKIRPAPLLWFAGCCVLVALFLLPLLSLGVIAIRPAPPIWGHLIATVLPRYIWNSLTISLGAGALAMVFGTLTAWLVTFYSFPLVRLLRWALLLPLAVPGYVAAYALIDFFEYGGPVQAMLRQIFNWQSANDYNSPELRTPISAVIVLASVLYPYVFMLVRAALKEQSACAYEVARALGKKPVGLFFQVGLPLCRPAIAAGVAIVVMEAISDFGVVDYFAVQTLTTGIFTAWLERGHITSAAQLSFLILAFIFTAIFLERLIRARGRFFSLSRQTRPITTVKISPRYSALATGFCLIPLTMGFILPVGVMGHYAYSALQNQTNTALWDSLLTSTTLGLTAAALSLLAALFLLSGLYRHKKTSARLVISLTSLGYATPGVVLAVGLLIPVAAFDHKIADTIVTLTGYDPGLLLTGSGFIIVLAYVLRFFALPLNATDSALGQISPSFSAIGRVLGQTRIGVLQRIHIPMIRTSLLVSFVLVFVDTIKELPATLLLRPFNLNTLSTRVYEKASLENIEAASLPALVIVGTGLFAVFLLLYPQRK